MLIKAALLNDTSTTNHFGCQRVVRILEKHANANSIRISARAGLKAKWWLDPGLLKGIGEADVIVINGEGTLHHGSVHGENLLKITEHEAARGKPIVLLNAIYQENPPEWKKYLEKLSFISARDSRSAASISELIGREVEWMHDLSLAEEIEPVGGAEICPPIIVGDSVLGSQRQALIDLSARHRDVLFCPITTTIMGKKPYQPIVVKTARAALRYAHAGLFRLFHRNAYFPRNEKSYIQHIYGSPLHLTGRFHAICISLAAGIPFVGLDSNSWKVEMLIRDVGLAPERLVSSEQLDEVLIAPSKWAYSDTEKTNIAKAIEDAIATADRNLGHVYDLAIAARGH